jgi:hypothetical protein
VVVDTYASVRADTSIRAEAAVTGVETGWDTETVLEVRWRARGPIRPQREEKANSAGRATHAARIADEVHMDPPPQAHIGVGHAPEYTMWALEGQLMSAVRSLRAADGAPPRAASAAEYSSAGRTPANEATRCPSGRTSSTVCAEAPG